MSPVVLFHLVMKYFSAHPKTNLFHISAQPSNIIIFRPLLTLVYKDISEACWPHV